MQTGFRSVRAAMRGLAAVVVAAAGLAGSALHVLAAPTAPSVLVAEDAKQPRAVVTSDGTVHVVAIHGGNVVVFTSQDRGRTFGGPVVAIDAKGRARGGRQRGPRIAADDAGRLVVTVPLAFDEAEASKRYPTAELWFARSTDGGATWSAPVRVNEAEKKAPEALHAMAVAGDGTVHVAWLDLRDRTDRGQDLWYAQVVDGVVSSNRRVATTVCECCAPGLALDGAGNPSLMWREGGEEDSREIFACRSSDGGKTFGKPVRVNRLPTKESGCPMSAPAILVSPDGKRCVVAWKDVREGSPRVWWAAADDPKSVRDRPVSDEPRVDRDHPSLAFAGDVAWVAWEEGPGKEQRVRARSTSERAKSVDVSSPEEGAAAFPVVATGAGLVVVAYETSLDGKERSYLRVLEDAR